MRYFIFGLLTIATVSVVRAESESKCEPGEVSVNFCNVCICNEDGNSKSCTKNSCPVDVYNEDGSLTNPNRVFEDFSSRVKRHSDENSVKKCEPNVLFHKFCNTCICLDDGNGATCTKKECPEGVYNEDGSRKPGEKVCEPFSHFKVNCDDCWCSGSGKMAMCTNDSCPEITCKPGEVTRKDCDECTCNKLGNQWTCIAKYCRNPLNTQNENN